MSWDEPNFYSRDLTFYSRDLTFSEDELVFGVEVGVKCSAAGPEAEGGE